MNNKEMLSVIIEDIKRSKKYNGIYDKTIERVVGDFAAKNNKADIIEKKSKNLLHQIWGAFYATRPDFTKLLGNLRQDMLDGKNTKESILPILRLQSSVKERISLLDNFYQKIFEVTGIPESITDYACGLNPLTLPWMQLPDSTEYRAYDIDQQEVNFLRTALGILKIS
jgi:16S rRNA (guanine(1405)-N(7))-methyltransferase